MLNFIPSKHPNKKTEQRCHDGKLHAVHFLQVSGSSSDSDVYSYSLNVVWNSDLTWPFGRAKYNIQYSTHQYTHKNTILSLYIVYDCMWNAAVVSTPCPNIGQHRCYMDCAVSNPMLQAGTNSACRTRVKSGWQRTRMWRPGGRTESLQKHSSQHLGCLSICSRDHQQSMNCKVFTMLNSNIENQHTLHTQIWNSSKGRPSPLSRPSGCLKLPASAHWVSDCWLAAPCPRNPPSAAKNRWCFGSWELIGLEYQDMMKIDEAWNHQAGNFSQTCLLFWSFWRPSPLKIKQTRSPEAFFLRVEHVERTIQLGGATP